MIQNYRYSIKVTTGASGTADVAIQIPGTFNGIDPASSNGRYFSKALIWAQSPVNEDRITSIVIKDLDGVVPPAATAGFPNYPILGYSIDPEMTFNSTVMASVYLIGQEPTNIGPADTQIPQFLPSGTYLCATFNAGDAASDRVFYGDFLWIKRS